MADFDRADIQSLLDEGLKHFSGGDPARALELWYRVLDAEPQNPTALEYVQYVRDNLHVDVKDPDRQAQAAAKGADWAALVEAESTVTPPAPEVEAAAPEVEAAAPEVEAAAPEVEAAAPVVEAAAPVVEAAAPEVEAAAPVVEAAAPEVEASAPEVEAAAPVVEAPASSPVAPVLGGSWGDLALGDVDVDPLTGTKVERAAESEVVRSLRRRLEETVITAAPATPVAEPAPEPSPEPAAQAIQPEAVPSEAAPATPVVEPAPEPSPEPAAQAIQPEAAPSEAVPSEAVPPEAAAPTSVAPAETAAAPEETAEPDPVAAEEASSPWDGHSGLTEVVDLDNMAPEASAMDAVLAAPVKRPSYDAPSQDANAQPSAAAPRDEGSREPVSEVDSLMEGARDLFELGDFSGSLELVEKVLSQEPNNAEAKAYFEKNESTLLKMYESKLGNLQGSPRVLTSPDEVIWMNMHHRAGFVLSQVDGELSFEDIAAISGMTRFETFRILAELVQNGVIG